MDTVRTVAQVRHIVGAHRRGGGRIALVPTMGFLHRGHLSLIEQARQHGDLVVVSIFVNPKQFNDRADLDAYPRDESRDLALAQEAGADVVFAPTLDEVYPRGFCTTVRIEGPITESLEGAVRGPAHFWGVATVVAKLFGIVQPDAAIFGQKDAQQCVVVRRLVTDLDLPIEIVVCPTVREPDGLAMSSRNVRLRGDERRRALALRSGLCAVEAAAAAGERSVAALEEIGRTTMRRLDVEAEYFRGVDPTTLAQVTALGDETLFVTAAAVGSVRLIDNTIVRP